MILHEKLNIKNMMQSSESRRNWISGTDEIAWLVWWMTHSKPT
jgi:hypothetical protein